MEQLAKYGIAVTNILIGIVALVFIVSFTGLMGLFGFAVAVLVSLVSVTTWAMIVSAYNKFIDK